MSEFPSITAHLAAVRRLPCVVTGRPDVTIHHCHGGSVSERLAELGLDVVKGLGRRGYSDALVIPLALEYHSLDGKGIDANVGVRTWEERYGKQADFLDEVGESLGYSLWMFHAELLRTKSKRRPSRG